MGGFGWAKGRSFWAGPQTGVLVERVVQREGLHPLMLPQVVVGVSSLHGGGGEGLRVGYRGGDSGGD